VGDGALTLGYEPRRGEAQARNFAVNEQVSGKPRNRWLWVAFILVVLVPVLYVGFQTAIQMEEGPADSGAPSS
jgi:nitrate reductase NapE component